jgi:hypothetical protein
MLIKEQKCVGKNTRRNMATVTATLIAVAIVTRKSTESVIDTVVTETTTMLKIGIGMTIGSILAVTDAMTKMTSPAQLNTRITVVITAHLTETAIGIWRLFSAMTEGDFGDFSFGNG